MTYLVSFSWERNAKRLSDENFVCLWIVFIVTRKAGDREKQRGLPVKRGVVWFCAGVKKKKKKKNLGSPLRSTWARILLGLISDHIRFNIQSLQYSNNNMPPNKKYDLISDMFVGFNTSHIFFIDVLLLEYCRYCILNHCSWYALLDISLVTLISLTNVSQFS